MDASNVIKIILSIFCLFEGLFISGLVLWFNKKYTYQEEKFYKEKSLLCHMNETDMKYKNKLIEEYQHNEEVVMKTLKNIAMYNNVKIIQRKETPTIIGDIDQSFDPIISKEPIKIKSNTMVCDPSKVYKVTDSKYTIGYIMKIYGMHYIVLGENEIIAWCNMIDNVMKINNDLMS